MLVVLVMVNDGKTYHAGNGENTSTVQVCFFGAGYAGKAGNDGNDGLLTIIV